MPRLTRIERHFTSREQAQSWFHMLRATAWPYVWCMQEPRCARWRVSALVEVSAAASGDPCLGDDTPGLRLAR